PKAYWLEMIRDNSFSFPSGHAQVATPLWLGFAYYVRNKGLALFYSAIGLMIALSRPYLGVHFLHDIGLGVLLGLAIYSAFIITERKHWDPLQQFSVVTQAILLFVLIALYLLSLHDVSRNVI
ncbi:MAG TPA: phosphatase PAP2 family protein, partial [Candidatus Berkiella sp.]|nr:phosphatase PAP2 family protein [Candidatus Berkiella sp.]